jgi:glyoxalase family protein
MTSDFDQPRCCIGTGAWESNPGTIITYFQHDLKTARRMRMGAGQTHHFAPPFLMKRRSRMARKVGAGDAARVGDGSHLFQEHLYTRSGRTHCELATMGPGFRDESAAELG